MPLDPHAAASPVQWREWTPEAFARARAESKPVLLRISAVWCHWCHVMDDSTDADPEVARRMNEWFVPVRVDNDERPDINDRYNLGGWPTTAFLTPDGDLITGGTYFPSDVFRDVLEHATPTGQPRGIGAANTPPQGTIDYAMIDGDPQERMECACGAAHCRKVITGDDWRLPELQRRYAGFFSRYLEDRFSADGR